MKKVYSLLMIVFFSLGSAAQTGNLQIYCPPGFAIYIDDKFAGKTTDEMSGLLIENLIPGSKTIRTYKEGFLGQTAVVVIIENKTIELIFSPEKKAANTSFTGGVLSHFGTFGLFNVNNVFTKADYTFGFSPQLDYNFHNHFFVGAEIMTMWGKPSTNDNPRMMIQPNVRFGTGFYPSPNISIVLMLSGGFAWWPQHKDSPFLTSTFNENRYGWDFKASAGIQYKSNEKTLWCLLFGYWASSSTSDDIVWITHDTMLLSFGPVMKF